MFEFGPKPWLPDAEGALPVPVGEKCGRCGEPIADIDCGLFKPHIEQVAEGTDAKVFVGKMLPWHRECHLRSILGSVGHLMLRCSCFGGTEEDPPTLSKRQAAIEACKLMGLYPF